MSTAIALRDTDTLIASLKGHESHHEIAALVQQQNALIESLKAGRVDVKALDRGELFVKTEKDGCMQAFRGIAELSHREGKIYTVDAQEDAGGHWMSGWGDNASEIDPSRCKWHLTGAGAAELAGIMSVNIVYEHTPGVPNPEPEYSADGREIIRLTYRLYAVGRDKAGNWRVERLVLPVATKDEFLETLAAKARDKRNKEAIRMGIKREFLDHEGKLPKGHIFEKLTDVGDDEIGYCCDYTHWAVKQLYGGLATRRKNASKKGYTVAKRLILSSWFGIGVLPVVRRGNDIVARVETYGWRTPFDQERMLAFARHVNGGGSVADFFGPKATVAEADVSDEDLKTAVREEAEIADGEDVPDDSEPRPEPEPGSEPEPQELPPEPEVVTENEHAPKARALIAECNDAKGAGSAESLIEERLGIVDIEGALMMGEDATVIGIIKTLQRALKEGQKNT